MNRSESINNPERAQREHELFHDIKAAVKANPKFIAKAIFAITAGAEENVKEAERYAIDMETIAQTCMLNVMGNQKHKWSKQQCIDLARTKIKIHIKRCRCVWDWFLKADEVKQDG